MRISLCGRVALGGPDGAEVVLRRPQVQLCVAVLVLERHRAVTRDELAYVLWGDELGAHWRGALRGVLTRVRDAFSEAGIDGDVLLASPGVVQLALPPTAEVDTEVARRMVNEAAVALRSDQAVEAAGMATAALDHLEGGFLVAVDRPWADARRQEVALLRRRSLRLLARSLVAAGDPSAAVGPLRRLLGEDPYDEDAQELLLAGLELAGERSEASAVYRRHVAALEDELGVGPSPSLRQVGERLTLRPEPDGLHHLADVWDEIEGATARAGLADGHLSDPGPLEPFVGRASELGAILDALAVSGTTDGIGVVVLEGEPGVGKTSLAREATRRFTDRGGRVLWGRCSAHGEIPFEPLTEALDRALSAPSPLVDLSDLHRDLSPILPALPAPSEPISADRARLFAAVAEAFRRMADEPVVWVVDDLQWATADTLALTHHVAEALAGRPVSLLATCRERTSATATVLESLGRGGRLEVLRLDGLDDEAVEDWLVEAAVRNRPGLASEVRARTGGNPLFVGHLIRSAQERGTGLDPGAVPRELATLLAQRIDGLPRDEDLLISAVAIAGDMAGLALVGDITGLAGPDLIAAADRLTRTGLVVEQGDRLAFRHALVADAVIDHMGAARRSWFHQRAALAIEARPRRRGIAAELARHHAGAGPDHAELARVWALAAATEALDQVAWAAAAELAISLVAEPASDPEERVGALIVLGRARRGMGDAVGAEEALAEALSLARLHGLRRRFGEAVLAVVGGGGRGIADPARLRWVPLLEEALAGLLDDGTDDILRVPLLGALSVALLLTGEDDDRRRCGEEALQSARRLGDRPLLARTLLDHRYALSPVEVDQRLEEIDEALALAEAAGLPEVTAAGLLYRYEDLLVSGRRVDAAATLAQAADHLARRPDAYWSWALSTWRVAEMLLDGDLEQAEAAASHAAGVAPDPAVGVACLGVNLVAVRAYQGRVGEMVDLLRLAADDNPFIPCYRAVLAYALAESGRPEAAALELAHFTADGFQGISHDTNRSLTLAMLAEAVVRLGDVQAAVDLLPLLEPYDGRYVVLNCYGGGGTVWGPASAQLAGLGRLMGDSKRAAAWRASARAECERMGDRSFAGRLRA